ncbi:MAG: polysaccharide deacetylase family protein [Gemmatimonadetes bacterium]|nr:polysaccharide deacetylase family protein [Gemmatimonadota bacterium]
MNVTTLLYHDVVQPGAWSSSGFEGPGADAYKLEVPDFLRQLDRIAQAVEGPAVPIGAALAVQGAEPWTFTVDDGGVTSATEIAPALEARGWVGHFFVTTGRIGTPGFVSEAQIRALDQAGHVVGSHTVTHPTRMARVPYPRMVEEWTRSRQRLEDILQKSVRVASVPGGYYAPPVARAAAEAGLEILYTSEPVRGVETVAGCTVVGRYCVKLGTSDDEVVGLATGRGSFRLRQWAHWNTKKVAKVIGGPLYLSAQRFLQARSR